MSRSRIPVHKTIADLGTREALGISQEQYAAFCEIPKSTLAMIETHQRYWPLGKTLNEIPLLEAGAAARKNPVPIDIPIADESRTKWEQRLRDIAHYRQRHERKLKRMVFLYETGQHLLRTLKALQEIHPETATKKKRLLDYWELQAQTRIEENHPLEQAYLRFQMEQFTAEEALLKGWLGEI